MSKVLLPKEVAEAVEHVWGEVISSRGPKDSIKLMWLTNWRTLDIHFPEQEPILSEYFRKNPVNYVEALVNGYEVEETPEDKLLAKYKEVMNRWQNAVRIDFHSYEEYLQHRFYYRGLRDGIQDTLEILGIEIEGIDIEIEGIDVGPNPFF